MANVLVIVAVAGALVVGTVVGLVDYWSVVVPVVVLLVVTDDFFGQLLFSCSWAICVKCWVSC